MSVWVTAAWMVGSAVVKGVSSRRQKNAAADAVNTQAIEEAARKNAAIDISAQMQRASYSAQAAEINRVYETNQLNIEKSVMGAVAANEVEAAAAGVTGNSVDVTQTALEDSAGTLLGRLDVSNSMALNKLEAEYREIGVNAALAQQHVITQEPIHSRSGLADLISNVARMQIGFSVSGKDWRGNTQ